MKILITGGSGFIGFHLANKLSSLGHDITIFDIKPPQSPHRFIQGSITSQADINHAMKGITHVFHLAALSNINTISDPVKALEVNTIATAKILKTKPKHIIFASTYFLDSDLQHLYTITKKASEDIIKLSGIPYTILRYGTVYGSNSRNEDVISIFIQRALQGKALQIHGDGEQTRHFIHIDDLINAHVTAFSPEAINKTFTIAPTRSTSIRELITTINMFMPVKLESVKAKNDWTKINIPKNDLYKPKISLEVGVKDLIEFHKKEIILGKNSKN